MEIFTQAGGAMVSRYGHYLSGVTWLGLLYYFNFVQVPSFATLDPKARTALVSKLVPRALWWFRWAAVMTLLTGVMILGFQEQLAGGEYFKTTPGISISTGILLALVMFANVWMVIWPSQRIVVASAQRVEAGGEPDPSVAVAARRAFLASRTNTFFSIPMLWFMGVTSHFAGLYDITPKGGSRGLYWLVTLVLVVGFELNGTGRIGGTGPGPTKSFLENHRTTIIAGFALWGFYVILWEILF